MKNFRLRRYLRFSLRTFLIAVTVLAVWMAIYIRSVQRQRASVAAIIKFGGSVRYDDQYRAQD